MTISRLEATTKIQRFRLSLKDDDLIKKIGIGSKSTLYKRIQDHSWKPTELALIYELK